MDIKHLNDRNGERRRLAGPRVRLAQQINAIDRFGNHPELNRSWRLVPGVPQRLERGFGEFEVFKPGR